MMSRGLLLPSRSSPVAGVAPSLLPAGLPTGLPTGLPRLAVDSSLEEHALALLLSRLGFDFSPYKRGHLVSAIQLRAAACGAHDAAAYSVLLASSSRELRALLDLVLIQVTSFFRDPEGFERLKQEALLPALARRAPSDTFHAWCAGCSTGEEAYSLAILLKEAASEVLLPVDFWVLATDIDQQAILLAQTGFSPSSAVHKAVPVGRRNRFFQRTPQGYLVAGSVCSRVSFSVESALDQPPLHNLDLISCRNLMIYLAPHAQAQLLRSFHQALRPGGILFLGPSESIGESAERFTAIDRKWKLYTANCPEPRARKHPATSSPRQDTC